MARKKRKRIGMPVGAKHKWRYWPGTWKETKVGQKTWKFTYEHGKTRSGGYAPTGTGMPTGSKLIWRIKANQYARKISPNSYVLIMKGTKRMGRWKTPKRKKWGK